MVGENHHYLRSYLLIIFLADFRKELEDKIVANGGAYKPNLTREETHLVAKEPTGAKYEFAEKWGIKIVAIEWLQHSLERGMILEESLYHPMIPAEKRGVGSWIQKTTSTTSLGKRDREQEGAPDRSRKLRRTASAKLESQNSGIWGDIAFHEVKHEYIEKNAWDDEGKEQVEILKKEEESQARHEEGPTVHERAVPGVELLLGSKGRKDAIFHDKVFALHGFNDQKASILESHVRSHGANVMDFNILASREKVTELEDLYVLIPHTMPTSQIPQTADTSLPNIMATELWIERCIVRKRYEDPFGCITNRPFRHFPIPGFESLKICSTAFHDVELLHLEKVVKLMGATYEEWFDPKASVLICNDVNTGLEKLGHAQLWGIPAVRPNWLWDSTNNGKVMPFHPYLLQPVRQPIAANFDDPPSEILENDSKSWTNNKALEVKRSDHTVSPKKAMLADPDWKKRRKETNTLVETDQTASDSFQGDSGLQTETHCNYESFDGAAETPGLENSSYAIPRQSNSFPLQEITPNSSPPKPQLQPSETKPLTASANNDLSSLSHISPKKQEDESLGPTISSLLAHHQQRASSALAAANKRTAPPTLIDPSQPRQRRRRQLLGRAPSTLSSHSHSNNPNPDLSRASSVDTAHTDGLGTPLSTSSFSFAAVKKDGNSGNGNAVSNVVYDTEHEEEELKRREECLQMTQLGYEDTEVRLWRERVERKITGGGGKGAGKEGVGNGKGKGAAGATPGRGAKGAGVGTATAGAGRAVESLGISKRTRLATGGR